jgi:Holliday junction resolvase
MKVLERDIAATVTAYLELKGWLVVRTEANAVTRGRGNGGIVKAGEPDARAFKQDKALHIEFKSATGKLSTKQELRHAYLKKFGIQVHIIRSIDDAKAMLEA